MGAGAGSADAAAFAAGAFAAGPTTDAEPW